MEGEKNSCSENGEGVGRTLEKSFDDNGKGEDGKSTDTFGKALWEVDVEHIGFGDMAGRKRKEEVEYIVSNRLQVEKGRKEAGMKRLNFQKQKFKFLSIYKKLLDIQKGSIILNRFFLQVPKKYFDFLINEYKVDLNGTKNKFISFLFFICTGEGVNLISP
ncbi:MAG: hypothetical protein K2N63_05320 [Lachnospiraceae bacterium]|nr:hypothetical protein [Lachnospiraceae bacterium]